MKVCSKCGSENLDNAKFCNNCGNDLSSVSSSQTNNSSSQSQYDFNPEDKNTNNQVNSTQQHNQENNTQQYNNQQYNNQQTTYQQQPYRPVNQKNVWIGPLLNVIGGLIFYILAGIGQFYLGLYKRGILLCLLGLIPMILGFLVMIESEYLGSLVALIIGIILIAYSAYDAYTCANAINEGKPIPLLFNAIDIE